MTGSPSPSTSPPPAVTAALEQVRQLRERWLAGAPVLQPGDAPGTDGSRFLRRLAMGDPQAPIEHVLGILEAHGLLAADGRLADDVQLVSIGDHFDWKCAPDPASRDRVARSGCELLLWLASHPPDQVVMILGNHDLSRVGELAGLDDAAFARAQALADVAYGPHGRPDGRSPAALLELRRCFPFVATAELLARDLSSFQVEQRRLVTELLEARRFRLAHAAADDLLLLHAGITGPYLRACGLRGEASARQVAAHLNRVLDQAVHGWLPDSAREPLWIEGLHRPGRLADEEGCGILYHRPSNPELPGEAEKIELGRRYDPRLLPAGLTQVIGHIGDRKSRQLLAGWTDDGKARSGVLRHLDVTSDGAGGQVRYRAGLPAADETLDPRSARLLFIDAAMLEVTDPAAYPLLDLVTRTERRATASP